MHVQLLFLGNRQAVSVLSPQLKLSESGTIRGKAWRFKEPPMHVPSSLDARPFFIHRCTHHHEA